MEPLTAAVLDWYDGHARDLPWRRPGVSAWAVLVSEVMLQQTPVARVLPAYAEWVDRWPTPAALAAAAPGEAVRAWGRLGYPRRAVWLRAAARVIVDQHGGQVPADVHDLLALPGVGDYTARAVAAFAYQQRHAVVDTNVRRLLARVMAGKPHAGRPAPRSDLRAMTAVLPAEPDLAARFCVAVMELGALVCTARSPQCAECPLQSQCAWQLAGRPSAAPTSRRAQQWRGSDRQARGALLAVLRDASGTVAEEDLVTAWPEPEQRERALVGLIADRLVEPAADGYRLPL